MNRIFFRSLLFLSISFMGHCYADDLLDGLLHNSIESSLAAGNITIVVPTWLSTKRDNIGYYNLLPEIRINSLDNFQTLEMIKQAMEQAAVEDRFGDYYYLWEVAYHNGYSEDLNDMTTNELAYEIVDKFGDDEDILYYLSNSSSTESMANLYKSLIGSLKDSAQKRDTTSCSNSNVPSAADCNAVYNKINGQGCISGNWCAGKCCASWSQFRCFNSDVINGKVRWCQDKCVNSGHSCKIKNVNLSGFVLNFCLGSTAGCKG